MSDLFTIDGSKFQLKHATKTAVVTAGGTIETTVFVNVSPLANTWDMNLENDNSILPLMLSAVGRDNVANATVITQQATVCKLVDANTGALLSNFDSISNVWRYQSSYFANNSGHPQWYLPVKELGFQSGDFFTMSGSYEIRYAFSTGGGGVDDTLTTGVARSLVTGANPVDLIWIFSYLQLV